MKLLATVLVAVLLLCAFYMIGGWALHELDWRTN
jgi:hypothetical protein